MKEETPQITWTLIPLDAAALAQLIEHACAQGAQAALSQNRAEGYLTAEQTALLLGFHRSDGRANLVAFKSWRQRPQNRAFLNLASRCGRRLRWLRSDVLRWMTESRKQKGAAHAC